MCRIFKIAYFEHIKLCKSCVIVFVECTEFQQLKKIVYVESVELCMFFEKLHTLNVQNYVNSLSNSVHFL